ncbi:MAG: YhdP family protein [Thiobacillaceae bacterium]
MIAVPRLDPRIVLYLRRALHYAAYAVAAVLIVLCAIALTLRLWIMPQIDRHRPAIERLASEATGVAVSIGVIQADWRGLNPRLRMEAVRFGEPGALPALTLPSVETTLSWTSLLLAEPRLVHLQLQRPHLVIHRDRQGVIRVAGIAVNTPGATGPFPDWLLRQRKLSVHQATVVWQDDMLGAPPLTLSELNLAMTNRLGRHRLGLTARPPDAVARRIDVRADFRGRSIDRLEDFSGQLFVQAEGAEAGALRTWAPWAQASVRSGTGALRFWLDFSRRQVDGVVGDVRLRQVRLGPSEDLPEIGFERIDGRLGWRRTAIGQDYFVERLSFVSPRGRRAAPASLKVKVANRPDGGVGELRVETEALQLEALTALIGAVPIPRQAHDLIEAHEPRGLVERLRLRWSGPQSYEIQASLRDVGFRAADGIPGLTGLSGTLRATERGGEARLDARGLGVQDASLFRHPLAFDTAQSRLNWTRRPDGGVQIELDDVRLNNPDLAATASGSIVLAPGKSPELDLNAHLTRGLGNAVWRYLPLAVSDDAYDWLRRGIRAGLSDETRLILRGPLDRFPFHEGGGQFRVDVRVRDAVIEVAPGWPRFIGVNGWVVFRDTAMEIQVDRAQVEGIPGIELYGIRGLTPDLHFTQDEILHIEGRARGPTAAFLDYIRASPVNDYTDRFIEPMRAEGRGELTLRLNLPLRRIDASTVSGVYRIADNRLDPGHGMPVLEHLKGDLAFTHRDLSAKGLNAQLLGQPAVLSLQGGAGGRLSLHVDGRIEPASLAAWVPDSLRRRLQGATRYRAEIGLREPRTELRVESDLKGLAIDLPEPLGKPAEQAQNLWLSHSSAGPDQTTLQLRYGQVLSLHAVMGKPGTPPSVSALVGQGETRPPRNPGLSLEIAQARLDLDPWLDLLGGQGDSTLPLSSLTLTAGELIVHDRLFTGTQVSARPNGEAGWQLQISGREVQGELQWQSGERHPSLKARFRRLAVPEAAPGPRPSRRPAQKLEIEANVQAESFLVQGRDVGRLELAARPEARGLRLQTLRIVNPDGRLEASGLLSNQARRDSILDVRLDSGNLNGLLSRLGFPGNVRRGELALTGRVGWPGGPTEFSLDRLSGDLDIRLRNGQFLKLDPGAGRLLGVLSLQALPRRINLDFRDIFSEGFAFDEITAPVHLERGVAQVADLRMRGPAASISIRGEVDLTRETQDLRVAVQPRLEDTLAAGAMLINPAVGVGALVASKVLKDPISRAATFEYRVRGSWTEPEVSRIPRARSADEAGTTSPP